MSAVSVWETNSKTSDDDWCQLGAVTLESMNGSENFILKSHSSTIQENRSTVKDKSSTIQENRSTVKDKSSTIQENRSAVKDKSIDCTEKGDSFEGYGKIFSYFLAFETTVHGRGECFKSLTNSQPSTSNYNEPHLTVSYIAKDGNNQCECGVKLQTYLIKNVLSDKTEEKIVHIYKTYLQGHVQHNPSKWIEKFINELQNVCIKKNYALLAGCTFQKHMTPERLQTLLSENFKDMTDELTAVIIGEMDSEKVQAFFSGYPPKHDMLHTIIKKRHKALNKLLGKLVEHGENEDSVKCKVLEMDGNGQIPGDNIDYDYAFYTVFQKIAFEGKEEAVCQKAVQTLIKEKWKKWCKVAFTIDACVYLLSVVFLIFVVVTGVSASQVTSYSSPIDYTRAGFEITLLTNTLRILVTEMYQVVRLRTGYLVDKINILDITASVLLMMVLPMRYTHLQIHWYIFAAAYVAWLLQIIKYAPVFKFTGVYAEALQKMIAGDFMKFGILISITIIMFSGTFLLVLKGENTLEVHNETKSFWSILLLGLRIMVEADSIVDYMGDDGYNVAGSIVMMMFMFFIIVVLLNILIAQLINTYQKIENTSLKGFYVRRAKIIARLEREQMPLLNNENKRSLCYEPEIKIDGKDIDMADSAILKDDPMTIVQNMEQSLKDALTDALTKLNDMNVKTANEIKRGEEKTDNIAAKLKELENTLMPDIRTQFSGLNSNISKLRSNIQITSLEYSNQKAQLHMEDKIKILKDELQVEIQEKDDRIAELENEIKRLGDELLMEIREKQRVIKKRCLICKIKS